MEILWKYMEILWKYMEIYGNKMMNENNIFLKLNIKIVTK